MERGYGTQGTESQHEEDIMFFGPGLDLLRDSSAFSCAVCWSGVGVNSIWCSKCRLWVHKKCIDVRGRLVEHPDYV